MLMPAASPPADEPRPGGWVALTASERGAAHIAVHTPNQDSVAVERAGANGVVTAVADGHGHSRHLRSARGSRLAVSIGCRVGQEFADQFAFSVADRTDPVVADSTDATVPAKGSETGDRTDPEADAEVDAAQADPASMIAELAVQFLVPTIAYGSTLLLCVALDDWLVLAQIGDGDVVVVRPDGTASLPVPVDPQLDGLVTTSLCGPDAVFDFRIAVLNTTKTPLLAALLATDGYGNAQVVEDWPSSFSKDLAALLRERDTRWLASQLPVWAARCASADGSADDATVALLISPAGQAARLVTPVGATDGSAPLEQDRCSEETTIPAVIRTDTVPSGHIPPNAGLAADAPAVASADPPGEQDATVVITNQARADGDPPESRGSDV